MSNATDIELENLRKQLAQMTYWRNFWRNHATTHERMWRETEELRQMEGQQAAAELEAAKSRISQLEHELTAAYRNLEDAQADVAEEIKRAELAEDERDNLGADLNIETDLYHDWEEHAKKLEAQLAAVPDYADYYAEEVSDSGWPLSFANWLERQSEAQP